MPTVRALLQIPHRNLRVDVDMLRQNLPIHLYLRMLHKSAVEGYLPKCRPDSDELDPEQQEPVETADRLNLLRYLVDKGMPTPRAPTPAALPAPPRPDTPVQRLTEEELLAIIHAPTVESSRHDGDEGAGA
jgi:hypothetical protein